MGTMAITPELLVPGTFPHPPQPGEEEDLRLAARFRRAMTLNRVGRAAGS